VRGKGNELLSDDQKQSQKESAEDGLPCQLISRRLNELRTHPSYARHGLSVSVSQLSALAALGEFAFRQPVTITEDGNILDGYARWELARRQGRKTILCIAHHLSEAEALQWLIQSHRPSVGWDAYSRVLLGHDLEPYLQGKARANQSAGGKKKGSSSLTEAETLDVRSEISSQIGVSAGSITKVKHLRKEAHPMAAGRSQRISSCSWTRTRTILKPRALDRTDSHASSIREDCCNARTLLRTGHPSTSARNPTGIGKRVKT
jgi:hypothetical protein